MQSNNIKLMKYITLPDDKTRRLSFYLAMEEYVARCICDTDCFFMWQVEPSVIFGRNQSLSSEVNMEYCRRKGINVYRRKSGGGCVYADKWNIMLSYVTSDDQVGVVFDRFMGMIMLVLRKLGIEAVSSARNDVLINGKKVSGTAFYHLPHGSIVHSTLLYDTDMENMTNAITPGTDKLQAKGIQSVRQRITILKDYTTLNIEELKAFIRDTLCSDVQQLSESDVAAIEQIEQTYLKEEFIHLL